MKRIYHIGLVATIGSFFAVCATLGLKQVSFDQYCTHFLYFSGFGDHCEYQPFFVVWQDGKNGLKIDGGLDASVERPKIPAGHDEFKVQESCELTWQSRKSLTDLFRRCGLTGRVAMLDSNGAISDAYQTAMVEFLTNTVSIVCSDPAANKYMGEQMVFIRGDRLNYFLLIFTWLTIACALGTTIIGLLYFSIAKRK